MAALTKKQKITALAKLAQKRCRGAGLTAPPQRTVLETLMYAALLENATFDKANLAYTILENYYIDWNEIRVCSVRELADTLTDLPNPEAAAERVRKALQGIFEKTYMFDLEDMRKKGKALAEHVKSLESMSAGTPYMIQYVAQVALDGHVVPFDEASLRIMRRLGLSQVSGDGTKEICVGLDRVILKKSSLTFAAQLHHFAAGYYDVPDSPELLSLLSAIDHEAVNRSWTSQNLSPVHSRAKPESVPAVPPAIETKTELVPQSKPQLQKESPKAPSAVEPAAKPETQPTEKVLPRKPAAKSPTQVPVQQETQMKKTPSNVSKGPKDTKVPPKKPVKPSVKQIPPTKKSAENKEPKKPIKKPKTVSPSNALRKKKPK